MKLTYAVRELCLQGPLDENEDRQRVNLIFELNQQLVRHLQSAFPFMTIGHKMSTRLYNVQQ
jgi:hypothetical protein